MKQVRILTKQAFEKADWEKELGEKMSFEDYVNMELAVLCSEKNLLIEHISHSDDMQRFVIIYQVIPNKK